MATDTSFLPWASSQATTFGRVELRMHVRAAGRSPDTLRLVPDTAYPPAGRDVVA